MTHSENHEAEASIGLKAYAILLCMTGITFILIQPIIVSAYIDVLGFSNGQAARILSANAVAQLMGAFLASVILERMNIRRVVQVSRAIILLLEIACMVVESPTLLILLRSVIGVLFGILLCVGTALIAGMNNPARIYGANTLTQVIGAALFIALVAWSLPSLGVNGIYGILAVQAFLCLVFSGVSPRSVAPEDAQPSFVGAGPVGLIVLVSAIAYFLATNMLWPNLTQIGIVSGLTTEQTGSAFAIGGGFGLLIACVVLWLGDRIGDLVPILIGVVTLSIAMHFLKGHSGFWYFMAGSTLASTAPLWYQTYVLAALAKIDPSGKLGALAATLIIASVALAPIVAAELIQGENYDRMLSVGQGCLLISGVVIILALAIVKPSRKRAV